MNPIDDDILQAYVDGELDTAAVAQINAALAHDDALARRVRQARSLRTQVQALFDPVLAEPVPAHLSALLQPSSPSVAMRPAPSVAHVSRRGSGVDRRHAFRRRWFLPATAVAASIAALALVLLWRPDGGLVRVHDGQQFAAGALSRALDQALASEPDSHASIAIGLSFRGVDGHICRTFVQHTRPVMAGLACHDAAGWSLPVLGAAENPAGGELRQAATALPPEVQAAVDARIRGDAFDARQERAARDSGWR